MDAKVTIIKEVSYKGHTLTKVEDIFGQEGVRIDGVLPSHSINKSETKQ